jgi:hypothetical protein
MLQLLFQKRYTPILSEIFYPVLEIGVIAAQHLLKQTSDGIDTDLQWAFWVGIIK